ncbi:hypothetical protein [Serratia marcescens]|uniref:hypothetical protein n=1 Tax=Serratia marcescens TaxID=615 RepID=UPI002FDB64D6
MFKNLMLFATCFIASFFILNKIPVLKNLVDMTVNQVGDWMNAANIAKSDGEFDPAFLPVVITYMLLATFILMGVVKRLMRKPR